MSRPARRPVPMPEATQELRVSDALELLDTGEHGKGAPSEPSIASIAPVGLDLRAAAASWLQEEVDPTMAVRVPRRRRALGRVLVGAAVTLSAAILVVAAVHGRRAEADPGPVYASSGVPDAPAAVVSDASPQAPPAVDVAPAAPAAVTGSLRVAKPALLSHVVLDGKRVTASPVTVSCGTHQLRVGRGRLRSIVVPCGGEVAIAR
jgi:hypothetical protein